MIEYPLAKELKDAGFPYKNSSYKTIYPEGMERPKYYMQIIPEDDKGIRIPTLSELIDACGEGITLDVLKDGYSYANTDTNKTYWHKAEGKTPEEAVARLWLALNKK